MAATVIAMEKVMTARFMGCWIERMTNASPFRLRTTN